MSSCLFQVMNNLHGTMCISLLARNYSIGSVQKVLTDDMKKWHKICYFIKFSANSSKPTEENNSRFSNTWNLCLATFIMLIFLNYEGLFRLKSIVWSFCLLETSGRDAYVSWKANGPRPWRRLTKGKI